MIIQKVPVLMYHSVGIQNSKWIWNFLTIPYQIFEDHLRMLIKRRFNTIDLVQLYDYVSSGKSIPNNSVVLTFDDGYLDNWVYAYPLLKKYGFKGTIFVNPEFVDPTQEDRHNLEDVWAGRAKEAELTPSGFLSWREMREMEKTGVMDIQSHAMTHTWYFTGPEIVDFRHPGDSYVWMNWNKDVSRKYRYLNENQDDPIEFGTSVYRHDKSLSSKRYYPDKSLDHFLTQYVKLNGGKEFFEDISWRGKLFQIVEEYKRKNALNDKFESELDQRNRLEWELKESKIILEKELGKKISFLCWPGGGYLDHTRSLANKYYVASTLASWEQTKRGNIPGDDPKDIKRMGPPYIEGNEKIPLRYLGGFYLYLYITEFKGDLRLRLLRKLLKGLSIIRYRYFNRMSSC